MTTRLMSMANKIMYSFLSVDAQGIPQMNAKHPPAESQDYRDYDDALDWLGLTPEERAIVELRLAVARAVRIARERQKLTQGNLAERIGSSQSRVAKVEAAARPGLSRRPLPHEDRHRWLRRARQFLRREALPRRA